MRTKSQATVDLGFHPRPGLLLLKFLAGEYKTPGGILLAETAIEQSQEADVIAIPAGDRDFQVGQRVTVDSKYAGTDLVLDGQHYRIVKFESITGWRTR